MKSILKNKQGISIGEAPAAVMIIGFVFLIMATLALVGEKYGDAMTENGTAYNVTQDLQTELGNNTSIAGIVLTIVLVGIVLTVLISIFALTGRQRI